jgi:pilus assembly protein CpaC
MGQVSLGSITQMTAGVLLLTSAMTFSASTHGQVAGPAAAPAAAPPAAPASRATAAPSASRAARDSERTAPVALPSRAPVTGNVSLAPQISLSEGKSTLMKLPTPATRLAVGDASIADVILLNPSEVYMLGKSTGTTNLILWNKNNDATIVDISVGIDTVALQSRIDSLLGGEKQVKITNAADTVVLSGMVSDVVAVDQIMSLANAYVQRGSRGPQPGPAATQAAGAAPGGAAAAPAGAARAGGQQGNMVRVVNMMTIAAPQQVMLDVKVAEVSKSLVDELGARLGVSTNAGSWTLGLFSNLLGDNPSFLSGRKSNGNLFDIDAQRRDGLVKVLAEPAIMSISGQEASFLAGGKIFIPVSQENSGGQNRITLEEKEFGVSVKFTPTVLAGGRINLKVMSEVSDLNREGVGITAAGINATAILPSFTSRRAATTVQLFDGQSFAIGGLIKNNVTANVAAVPVLGEVPVLGPLFRSNDFQTDRSELVFIITPRLVKPLQGDVRLPTDSYIEPSRREFFIDGKMEGERATAPANAPRGFEIK